MAEVLNNAEIKSLLKKALKNTEAIKKVNDRVTSMKENFDHQNTHLNNRLSDNYVELSKQINALTIDINKRFNVMDQRFNTLMYWQFGTVIGIMIAILAGLGKL